MNRWRMSMMPGCSWLYEQLCSAVSPSYQYCSRNVDLCDPTGALNIWSFSTRLWRRRCHLDSTTPHWNRFNCQGWAPRAVRQQSGNLRVWKAWGLWVAYCWMFAARFAARFLALFQIYTYIYTYIYIYIDMNLYKYIIRWLEEMDSDPITLLECVFF